MTGTLEFSPTRTPVFRFPVLFPEGLRYYESLELAEGVCQALVEARMRKQRVSYETRMVRRKRPHRRKGKMK